jgi:ElaB/YqjD/DUF883 family membrane-anchored ribosome-binding protein
VEHSLFRFQHHPSCTMNDFSSTPDSTPLVDATVVDAVHEFKAAAEAKAREFGQNAGEKLADLKETASRLLEDSSGKWKELGDHAMAYVKENPGKSVLAGLGAGFLIGLLFRDQ